MERRQFLVSGSSVTGLTLAAVSGLVPARAQNAPGWNKAAFESRTFADAARALGASSAPTESKELVFLAPEIAENGNVVRLSAQSKLPNTTLIAFIVEKNPNALAAAFDIPPGSDAQVATNIKMAQTSSVYALARVGDKFFYALREVKVTLGGCGG